MKTVNNISILIFLALTLYITALKSQSLDVEWGYSFGSKNRDDNSSCMVLDNDGNVYTIGSFKDTIDADPGTGTFDLISKGGSDIYIIKLSNDGSLVWAKSFGGTSNDDGISIALDDSGNVYSTGSFHTTADFDPGAGVYKLTNGNRGAFIQKLNSNGEFVWAKAIGGSFEDKGYSIAYDKNNGIYVTGYFSNTTDFDPGVDTFELSSNGLYDIFILKLDINGDFQWARSVGGATGDYGRTIDADFRNGVYLTGFFNDTVDFDPGTGKFDMVTKGINNNLFILKLDTSGNFQWVKSFGDKVRIDASYNPLTIDVTGNMYLTGYYFHTVDFDPGPGVFELTSAGSFDIFILKLYSSGDFQWVRSMGGSDGNNGDYGKAMVIDNKGNLYCTGTFSSTCDFDPDTSEFNLTSMGKEDVFISKMDSNGVLEWSFSIGGSLIDDVTALQIDSSNKIYLTGNFESTSDFDPGPDSFNLTSSGYKDFFIIKFNEQEGPIGSTQTHNTNFEVKLFPNPAEGTLNILGLPAGYFNFKIFDMMGQEIKGEWIKNTQVSKLDIGHLKSGAYLIFIENSTSIIKGKFVVR